MVDPMVLPAGLPEPVDDGVAGHMFPPDRHALEVLAWLREHPA